MNEGNLIYKLIRKSWLFFKMIVSYLSYIPFHLYKPTLKFTKDENPQIVVSFTTYPARLRCLPMVVGSLIRQTMKPDIIVLYLSKEQFKTIDDPVLKGISNQGVRIKLVEDDLKSHKKYYYAMIEYPNSVIITVDDDIIYNKNMIAELFESFRRHPSAISAKRVHKMKFDDKNRILPYNEWDYNTKEEIDVPSLYLMATGCGGVLYPPRSLHCSWSDIKAIKETCLRADDLWLKVMELLNGVPVVLAKSATYTLKPVWDTNRNGLAAFNVELDGNDLQLQKICEYKSIDLYSLITKD